MNENIDMMLSTLKFYWKQHPTLRFCQVISNIAEEKDIFYVEDKDFFSKLCKEANLEEEEILAIYNIKNW